MGWGDGLPHAIIITSVPFMCTDPTVSDTVTFILSLHPGGRGPKSSSSCAEKEETVRNSPELLCWAFEIPSVPFCPPTAAFVGAHLGDYFLLAGG